jgi:peroxiredoxin Q/BCP
MLSWFAPLLSLGQPAPDFTLPDDAGRAVQLSEHRGRNAVVLVFYPMDETPGCRAQLCEIRDRWTDFERQGIAVYGVNPGSAASHAKFRAKHWYPFPLLVDKGQRVAQAYGAKGLVPRRTVYGIDLKGRVAFAERGKPAPDRVLAAITASQK